MTEQVKEDLKTLFSLLDSKEETDSGTVFSPTYISTVRVLDAKKLNEILPRLRAYSETGADA